MRPHIKELRMFLQSEEDPALRAANQVMSEAETSTVGREKSTIYASIVRINERGMRPMELVKLFGLDPEQARVVRVKTHFTRSNTIHSQQDSDTEFTWHLKNRLDDKQLNVQA